VSDQAKGDPFGEKWGNKVYKTSTHGSWTKESSAKRDEEIAKTVPTRRSAAVLREAERTIVFQGRRLGLPFRLVVAAGAPGFSSSWPGAPVVMCGCGAG
jgi:hypothetical protein